MRLLFVSDFFRTSNYIEAGVWGVIAAVVLVFGARWRISMRGRIVMFITLVAFGVSDLVEARTGAWWDPWWLLVWKGACVAVLLAALVVWARNRKHKSRS